MSKNYDYCILCEKKSQMDNYAKALNGKTGVFSLGCNLDGQSFVLVCSQGHLFNLVKPQSQVPKNKEQKYANWEIANLPWDINDFSWKLKLTSSQVKPIYENICKNFNLSNNIIIATDNDPTGEGTLLADEIIIEGGFNNKKHFYRSFHADESAKEIKKALCNLKDLGTDVTTDPDYIKANFRRKWDFLSQQETMLATTLAGGNLLREGRLKTFIKMLIGKQFDLINDYVEIPYFEPRFKDENNNIFSSSKVSKYSDEKLVPNTYHPSNIISDKKETKYTSPPHFYDLDKLAAELSTHGFTTKQVLTVYQTMYNDQVVSYPRNDDKKISIEQFNDFLQHADAIADCIGINKQILTHRQPRPTHIATGMSHGANRPGPNVPSSLLEVEQRYGKVGSAIYDLLARNTLAMLCEDYEYLKETGHLVDYPDFVGSANIPVSLGFKEIFNMDDEDIQTSKGLGKKAEPFIFRGTNPKPSPVTKKWLTKQLEKYNVGTGATRASTYAVMVDQNEKNSPLSETKGKIAMTSYGELSYKLMANTNIASLKLTEDVYNQMDEVSKNPLLENKFLSEIAPFIINDIAIVQKNVSNINLVEYSGGAKGSSLGKCPFCGSDVVEFRTQYGKTIYKCKKNNDKDNPECKFVLFEKSKFFDNNIRLSSKNVSTLLSGGHIQASLKSKTGKPYKAYLKLKITPPYVNFELDGYVNQTKNIKK